MCLCLQQVFSEVFVFIFNAAVAVAVAVAVSHDSKEHFAAEIKMTNFDYLMPFVGIAAYSIEGIGLVLPLRRDFIRNNSPSKFRKYYFGSFGFIVCLYLLFGVMNYLKFGTKTQTIVFYNYSSKQWITFGLENLYAIVPLKVVVFFEHDEFIYSV